MVDPFILGERYGVDAIRYHIMREMTLGADSSFSNEIMINRINTDLANGLGNLVSRTVAMIDKYFGGTLPTDREEGEFDADLIGIATALRAKVDNYVENTQLNLALEEIFKLVSRANKYIDETTPWILGKDETKRARLATVLYNLLEAIRVASTLLSAFMPTTMPKVFEQIGAGDCATYENAGSFGVLPLDVTVHRGEALFPRIDVDKEIDELNAIYKNKELAAEPAEEENAFELPEHKPEIAFDDFEKVELRVAKVLACEKVKKSKKLLKFTLDDGEGERIILSGIAEYYDPEELVGKNIAYVANLAPRKMMGIESRGMILSAESGEGLKVVTIDDSILPGGSLV